ncbi:MAG: type II secretion system protein [Phycisphaerae bacterium]|nr:type II secretion system protein [Phycisphaerae bacterium]
MKARNKSGFGFTIVELLTVMSIMVLLMGILLPAFNKVKRYSKKVKQKAQFKSIGMGLELYNAKWDGYPDSGWESDNSSIDGWGAVVLSNSLMGEDLLGYTPIDGDYKDGPTDTEYDDSGRDPYLEIENANVYKLRNVCEGIAPRYSSFYVLCDIYTTNIYENDDDTDDRMNGQQIGMPILYFRANSSGTEHPVDETATGWGDYTNSSTVAVTNNADRIYFHDDNHQITDQVIRDSVTHHPVYNSPYYFYNQIWNDNISNIDRPYRSDSYILMSAGFDGLYGTKDDIFNFGS